MNSILRKTMPAALLAGGALVLASAGPAGAQVPVPAEGLPTGGLESPTEATSALCDGPLGSLGGLSGVCEVAGEDQIQIGDAGQVVPQAGTQQSEASSDEESAVNVELQGDEPPGDCDGCEPEEPEEPEEPCDSCPPTTVTTVPTTVTTAPPETTTTTAPAAPPTSQVAAQPPAGEELPRTGSTVAPFVAAGAALVAVGASLIAARRFAAGRRA